MYVYYKQKEIDDLAKVEAVNEILKELFYGLPATRSTVLTREDWLEILSGATAFKEVYINAFMKQHFTEADLKRFVYCICCPEEVQSVGEYYTEQLGDIRFRPDVVEFAPNGLPQISADKIKDLYPRWYCVEVADLKDEQIRESKDIAQKYGTPENFRYACKHIYNADTFIPRPGFRWTFTTEGTRKAVVTFTETDYYQDMAKRKLNL